MAEFRMPSLGADMESGTLLEWLIKPGDVVHHGDVIAVVDTEKAAIEVECFVDGTVAELIVAPGQRVPVGAVLARIGAEAPAPEMPAPPVAPEAPEAPEVVVQAVAPAAPAAQPPPPSIGPLVTSPLVRHLAQERGLDLGTIDASGAAHVIHRADVEHALARPAAPTVATVATTPAPATAPQGHVRAAPRARKLAAEAGLDLATVSGTGRDGAITPEDVERALALGPHAPAAAAAPAAAPAAAASTAVTESAPESDHAESMRHAIAALMDRSNREIPHYYLTSTIDMSAASSWLRARNRELPVEERLVPAALLLKATALAARKVGQLNGSWVDGGFRPSTAVDIGLVVSLRRGGIMVPVVPDAPSRSVGELMAMIRDLVQRARTGRLRGSDLTPPSITVSNLGDQGVDSVLGVIYPPQVALVGFGAVVDRPWAVDGMLGVRPVVTMSLAADHRASDGAIGARFLNHIALLLEKPEEL